MKVELVSIIVVSLLGSLSYGYDDRETLEIYGTGEPEYIFYNETNNSFIDNDELIDVPVHSVNVSKQKIDSISAITQNPLSYPYNEKLNIKPLPKNFLLASFQFSISSNKFLISKNDQDPNQYTHYTAFPKSIGPILQNSNTRQLHLRFTHGLWDSGIWGQLPHSGLKSGGPGMELWSIIEAKNKDDAFHHWIKLTRDLGGLFCASINFIDSSKTTYPISSFNPVSESQLPIFDDTNQLYLIRAALANEPVCTENLTPFVKLLPTKGKSGISSLLDGHRFFDSPWNSMSIDVFTICDEPQQCYFNMEETIETVFNVPNVLARLDRPIPKPLDGSDLRCDPSKPYDAYQCFPLPESTVASYELSKLFGKKIMGGNMISAVPSKVCVNVTDNWNIFIKGGDDYYSTDDNCFDLKDNRIYDIYCETSDTTKVTRVEKPPVYVTRSLTGYGQDQGGIRIVFKNPNNDPVVLTSFESLPWFMRIYLSSLQIESLSNMTISDVIQSTYYLPAIDRKRPTHLEHKIIVPSNTTFALTYQFDKSLLKYAEYPPDANHGFEIESTVITVTEPFEYELRTSTLLLYLSTPDFSMPYNVIILTSTVMGLAFGTLFNLMIKKLVTKEEADKIIATSRKNVLILKLKKFKNLILKKKQNKSIDVIH